MEKGGGNMGDFNEVRYKSDKFGSVFNVQGANVFNSFITNVGLEEVPLAKELFQSCKQYGHVVDTFIPNKRSKTGRRFGFVRFINVFNEERLVNNLCTVLIDRFKLHANIARFHRTHLNEKKSMPKKAGGVKKDTEVNEVSNSYVHVVKGQMQPGNKESEATLVLVLSDECLLSNYLSKSLFGRVKQFASLANIMKAVKGSMKLFQDNVEGIPFKLWSDNTFKRIATKWGEGLFGFMPEKLQDGFLTSWKKMMMKNIMMMVVLMYMNQVVVVANSDVEGVLETIFEESGQKENNLDEEHTDKQENHSGDPFSIYKLLKKKKGNVEKKNNSEHNMKYPPGFTPKEGTDVVDMHAEETRNDNIVNLSDHNAEEVNNTFSGSCPKKNSKEDVSNSVCSGHFKTSMVPRTSGSILSLMDELVKVGQVMGYKMDRCLAQNAKKDWVKELCVKNKVNFLALQETKMENMEMFSVKMCWGNFVFDYVHSDSVGNSRGILCVWDPNSFRKSNTTVSDYFIMIRGVRRQTGNDLLIIAVYAPHDLKDKQMLWDYLTYEIGKWKREVVIMSDFNEVRYKSDRFRSVFNVQGANVFNSFITNARLEEVPLGGSSFTWCHKSATKTSKLDIFLISEKNMNTYPNITAITLERYLSDHRPILLRESHFDYGPNPFRFFHHWIEMEGFSKVVEDAFFHHWIEMEGFSKVVEDAWREGPCDESNAIINMMIKLKYLKTNIREWNKKNMLSAKNIKAKYKDELEALEAIIDKGDGNVEVVNKRMEVVNTLRKIDKICSSEMAQKAKVKWSIEWMRILVSFMGEFFHHFSSKFDKPDARRKHIEMKYPKTLTCDQQVELESDVSNEEIKRAVWDCRIDKSPGPDGFTFGFFRRFWNLIENDVYDAVKYFFTYGVIPKGCNSSALIPKIPDANTVKDFRPISLIESLYKIVAKNLANRLVGVLGDIVNEVQSAFIVGRQILDGPFILNEILQWCKIKKKQSLIFKVDFKKAYDSVRWDFLDDILKFLDLVKNGVSIKLSSSLSIYHMFYADDAVFVGQWCDGVLVDSDKVKCVASKLGCLILKTPFSYFGSKVGGSMSRVHTWNEVVDRLKNQLSKCKMKTLSIGGSQFFKGQELNSKKASWVNWKKVLAPKEKGGIGVSSLYALNRGPMFKWMWRFYTQSTSLWVRVIKAIHGDDGKVGGYVKDGAKSCWLSIVNEINSLKNKGKALKNRYPRIYSLETCKLITVGMKLAQTSLDSSFRRVPRSGVEQEQFDELSALVYDVTLTPMSDRWIWDLESLGYFSVASVRNVIDDKSLPKVDSKTRWIKYVPIKVNVHAWKVKTDSLPTRFNVSHRAKYKDELEALEAIIDKGNGNVEVELDNDVSNEEIKRAVWDCGIDKSPGPDEFTFGFYHRFWNLIENDVYDVVKYFCTYGVIPKGCNSSFIALIPKIFDANMVKDFRPISLIGSLYKIVAKILANCLVGVLGDIVNKVQSAFIAGRQIFDGPFILNEVLQWCKIKKKQSLIFKVDFEKAYDSVRWDFLDGILKKFGFGEKWCKWIQSWLRSLRGSIIINGSPMKEFQFFKGLKQGDPLSSFLFILIMESLHLSFQRVVDAGIFKGIKLSSSLSISHMFYVDDVASGLRNNMSKSKIMGVLVNSDKVKCAASKLECLILKTPFSYLGSKVGGSMSRVHTRNEVVDRVKNWLSKWKIKRCQLEAIHGDDGKVGGYVKDGSKSCWLSIMNEINSLKNKGINLLDFMHVKLGNGDKTAFWEDIWIEESRGVESSMNNLMSYQLWCMTKVIDDKSLPEVDSKTRWIKYVPIKVNVLAWKVKTDSLPTRFNVSGRGIHIDSIMCAICDKGAETSSHLFFSCCMARQTVRMITRWWDVPYGEVDSYEDWINWFVNLRLPYKHKQMLEGSGSHHVAATLSECYFLGAKGLISAPIWGADSNTI
nr:RNA-directed DNA polymerase, eukaryota [Tanacetum cinerariifolium]